MFEKKYFFKKITPVDLLPLRLFSRNIFENNSVNNFISLLNYFMVPWKISLKTLMNHKKIQQFLRMSLEFCWSSKINFVLCQEIILQKNTIVDLWKGFLKKSLFYGSWKLRLFLCWSVKEHFRKIEEKGRLSK